MVFFFNHPYLLIFQKQDWQEYLVVLAEIYDFLEEENTRVPFEVLKSLLHQHYAHQVQNVDVKVADFFTMAIVELGVLKDSHDQYNKRYLEPTGHGKELFKLIEGLIAQRTRYTGTSAETLLASLNNLLLGAAEMSREEALLHHREKIKAYQEDMKRIEQSGPKAAELLPLTHSAEALFNQAEEAAIYILTASEDVKTSIEKARQDIADNYLRQKQSAGANLRATIEFHHQLNQTPEYRSYTQAKELFSQLQGSQARFKSNDVHKLLSHIKSQKMIEESVIKKSRLAGFASQFKMVDASIKDKKTSQLRILEQQVHYALATHGRGYRPFSNTHICSKPKMNVRPVRLKSHIKSNAYSFDDNFVKFYIKMTKHVS